MISPAARRLIAYVGFTALVLGLLELVVRKNETLFRAISHRVLTKAELLDRKPPVQILFFGTSRTWDGVSVPLFAEELAELRGSAPQQTFNLATTGSSLETLEYLADRFAARPGLELAMIELSVPQLKEEPLPWIEHATDSAGSEEMLQRFARRNVRLIELRGSFVGENFVRMIPLVFFPSVLDGSEVNPKDFLRAARGERAEHRLMGALEPGKWQPTSIEPAASATVAQDLARADLGLRVARIAHRFQQHGVRVAFFVPPLRADDSREEHSPKWRELFAEVARQSSAPIWDFVAASNAAEDFRDTSHLSRRGRARFSQVLAGMVAGTRLLDEGGAR